MAQTFDLILRGGTVVNHDGEGVRDLAVTAGRIAAIGDLSQASAGRDDRLPRAARPAGRDRHPGAFPRARCDHKEDLETGSRGAVMGGVTAVFEMPNTDPLPPIARSAGRQGRGAAITACICDFAFFVGGTRDNVHDICRSSNGCRAAAGVKVFMGSSTGSLLVEDDEGVRNILKAIRRRASFHSEDEDRAERAQGPARSRAIRARTRSGATRWRRCAARSGSSLWRGRPASASTCCTSRPPRRWRS